MKLVFATFLIVMVSAQASGEAKKLVPGPSPERIQAVEMKKQRIESMALTELETLVLKGVRDEDVLKQYYPHSTDLFFELLGDPLFETDWHDIAKAIGIVGDLKSVDKLKTFITAPLRKDVGLLTEEDVKKYALLGIKQGNQYREVPWFYEFAVTHSLPDDWVQYFGNDDRTMRLRRSLAHSVLLWLSRRDTDESVKVIEEIKSKYIVRQPLQEKTVKNDGDVYLLVIQNLLDDANKRKSERNL